MFTTSDIDKKLQWLVTVQTQSIKEFVDCLKNKKLTLESRWSLYKKYHHLLPIQNYGSDFFNYDFIVDAYNRHELIDYVSVIELLEEGCYEKLNEEEILTLKEQALSSGYQGFYFDW